jgi:hypothetical protein
MNPSVLSSTDPDSTPSGLFSTDFIQSVASSLDEFDPSIFRTDGDIDFERDFGQWFDDPHSCLPDDPSGNPGQGGSHMGNSGQEGIAPATGPDPNQDMTTASPSTILSNPPSMNPSVPSSTAPDPMSSSLFSSDFIQSIASSLDEFDPSLNQTDGDINFEHDFGQWFNDSSLDFNLPYSCKQEAGVADKESQACTLKEKVRDNFISQGPGSELSSLSNTSRMLLNAMV